jgi:hypothetical protein
MPIFQATQLIFRHHSQQLLLTAWISLMQQHHHVCETLEFSSLTGYAEGLVSYLEGFVAAALGLRSLVFCDAIKLRCKGCR